MPGQPVTACVGEYADRPTDSCRTPGEPSIPALGPGSTNAATPGRPSHRTGRCVLERGTGRHARPRMHSAGADRLSAHHGRRDADGRWDRRHYPPSWDAGRRGRGADRGDRAWSGGDLLPGTEPAVVRHDAGWAGAVRHHHQRHSAVDVRPDPGPLAPTVLPGPRDPTGCGHHWRGCPTRISSGCSPCCAPRAPTTLPPSPR